jgi:hypothetical protein
LDLEVDGDRLPGEVEGRRLIKERLDVSGRGVGVVANSPRSLIKERLDVSGRGVGVVAISPRSFTTACDQEDLWVQLRQKVVRFN